MFWTGATNRSAQFRRGQFWFLQAKSAPNAPQRSIRITYIHIVVQDVDSCCTHLQ
uniref:Uncharacterized protein n=1 Tax=Arundo donax TaxID=35708 RepID=A0A0A8Z5D8_ARUDO